MSQLIACKSDDHIVLAADSKAVDVDDYGNLVELRIDRLHQLSEYSAILTGGTAAGEAMCHSLKHFVIQENLTHIDEIYRAGLPLLASEYERFMRKTCEVHPIDPIHQVTFILAGYTSKNPQNPFQMYLLWTKRKLPMLGSDEIGTAFSVPRSFRIEHHLHQLVSQKAGLDRMMTEVRRSMETAVQSNKDAAEPLSYAWIDDSGFRRL
ncbi:MAG: hypothetical protein PVG41_13900 [Desulfobacteraceae bacterium]|jgi:hypothetical protein